MGGKSWKDWEIEIIKKYYPNTDQAVIESKLPGRSWKAITLQARRLKIYRESQFIHDLTIRNNLEKYGVRYPSQLEEVKEKCKKTNLKKYGVDNVFQNEEIQKKIKDTNLEKYGVENPSQSSKIKNQKESTLLKNYNVKNPQQSKEIQEKTQQTNLKKYGDKTPLLNKDVQEKITVSNIAKYGVVNVFQNEEIQKKIKKTNLKKYNVENPQQSKEIQEKTKKTNLEKYGVVNPSKSKEIVDKIYQTKKENNSFGYSQEEQNLLHYLKDIFHDIEYQYKSREYPFNSDFYIPEKKLYIEYQGLWTHGKEPYNGKNLPKHWVEKSLESNYYKNAVTVYTDSDPKKREFAFKNDLNFLELWSSDYISGFKWLSALISKGNLVLTYTQNQLLKEFNLIKKRPGSFERAAQQNKIIEHFQSHFYQKERELWNNPKIREKLIANRIKFKKKDLEHLTIKELLLGFKISGINKNAFSFFSPFWIKAFIEKYNIKSIYDPCAGWGHRMLGAMSCNVLYIGNDICNKTYVGLNKIKEFFNFKNVSLHNEFSEEFIPNQNYDAVFTCPPYFNREKYEDLNSSYVKFKMYKEWLNIWWRKTVKNSIICKPKYFSFVINNKYKEDLKKVCLEENLLLIDEIIIGPNNLNHFQRTKSVVNKKEILLVFKINF